MITLDLSILNQKGTPMFYSDIFANRPAAGVVGRIFISTDTFAIYRDTGSAWDQIGGSGSGITGSGTAGTLPIWTSSSALGDSSLLEGSTKISTIKDIQADAYYLTGMTAGSGALYWTSDRVTLANYNVGGSVYIETNGGTYSTIFGTDQSLTNYGYIAATPTLTAANNASSLASFGINTLSYAAGFSSNNIGALYGGMAGFNLQTFAGSATFAQANVASGGASVNSIDFSSAGSTITMTQSSGIRVMSGQQNLFQYQGTNSGTITHAAISQNTGFYRPSGASGTLTITNAYSHLINALDDYGAGFSFTNRWGIYQAGASDKNYFAANVLLGSVVDNGNRLQVAGNAYIGNPSGNTTAQIQSTSASGESNVRLINTAASVQYDWQIKGIGTDGRFSIYDNAGSTGEWFTITQSGNVGIGVINSYGSKLAICPSSNPTTPTDSLNQISIGEASQNNAFSLKIGYIFSGGTYLGSIQSIFANNPSTLILNGSGGNVGIGNLNPLSKLTIGDLSNVTGTLNDIFITGDKVNAEGYFSRLIFSNSTQAGASTASIRGERGPSSNFETQLTFYTNTSSVAGNGTEAMRITGGQNVLINTTADSDSKCIINSSNSAYALYLRAQVQYASQYRIARFYGNSNLLLDITSSDGSSINLVNYQAGNISFYTSGGAYPFVFSGAGNLLVGTSVDTGQKLQIIGQAKVSDKILAYQGGATGYISLVSGGSGASGFMEIYKNDGSTRLGYIGYSTTNILFNAEGSANFEFSSNGNLLIGTGSNPGQKLYLNGSLRIDGQTSATAGGSSGQHLIINCDGTQYKIALLNN